MTQPSHSWKYIRMRWNQPARELSVPLCLLQLHSQQLSYGVQPLAHQLMTATLLSHAKKEILSFATRWMCLGAVTLSNISQSQKDQYHVSLIRGSQERAKNYTYIYVAPLRYDCCLQSCLYSSGNVVLCTFHLQLRVLAVN